MTHTIQNGCLRVGVAEHGAELQSIRDREDTEYLWQGDPAYWSDRAPNLFPYVARLTGGKYRLDGREYRMDIHGLAPYRDFLWMGMAACPCVTASLTRTPSY